MNSTAQKIETSIENLGRGTPPVRLKSGALGNQFEVNLASVFISNS